MTGPQPAESSTATADGHPQALRTVETAVRPPGGGRS